MGSHFASVDWSGYHGDIVRAGHERLGRSTGGVADYGFTFYCVHDARGNGTDYLCCSAGR